VGTYALQFAYEGKKTMYGRFEREHMLLLLHFPEQFLDEKTPYEKLPLDTSEVYIGGNAMAGKVLAAVEWLQAKPRSAISNAGDPGG